MQGPRAQNYSTARVVGTGPCRTNDCGVRVRPNLGAVDDEAVIGRWVGISIWAVRGPGCGLTTRFIEYPIERYNIAQENRQEGRQEERQTLLRQMLANASILDVSRITGISEDEIKKIVEQ